MQRYRSRRTGLQTVCLAAGAMLAIAGNAAAQSADRPRIETNEVYVQEVTRAGALAIGDPLAVFAVVLDSLPDRVKVYPTENYYYFRFIHDGTVYAGNIRLDPRDRDQGKIQFGYYKDMVDWKDQMEGDKFAILDASRGVTVERLEPLVYRVTYGAKSVVFALNDLSQVKPPPSAVGPDERFLGPIFDESGIRFFLLYNSKLKSFHYILDETVKVADELFAAKRTDRILIGRRTGFAFYRDHRLDRKILIGAFEVNSRVNNYFDGPFDQLPENFIEGEALREAILDSDPSVKGQIDRLGNFFKGEVRYLIHPYLTYRTQDDLHVFHECATSKKVPAAAYYNCFVINPEGPDDTHARPLALKNSPRTAAKSGRRR